MNILFFTDISPFPANGGEKIRSNYLLKALARLGHQVIALVQNEEGVDLANYQVENVVFYTHAKRSLDVVDRLAGKHYFQRSGTVLQLFGEVCSRHKIDVAVLDYGYIGQYIRFFTSRGIRVVLGTHNAQPMITQQVPAKNIIAKIRRFQLVSLEKLHERLYFKKAAAVLVVSEDDRKYHERFIGREKVFFVPNFLDEKEYALSCKKQPKVLVMTANFGQYMNFQGLKWFVEEVWNQELAERYDVWLVGRRSREALTQLTGADKWNNIVALGKVDDVKWYISVANGVIIPLLHGAGTRLKCLEAMALSTPIISTSKGVEGVASKHFLIADTPEEFRKVILDFNGDEAIGQALREDFMREYSADVNTQRLRRVLSYVTNVRKSEYADVQMD
ncbi:glycosyltransferase family 4 protein [Chitinophaga japonensis]|uniref:Glycosyltransferase involved in cell wall biosynthesis n=1 Tax=Chitinophaga japonensis TaxID=104662 RepID=A0A562T5B9_CHIJA|nr:glycosyltransferase family 4 protein [Chitinophaga japonensis]TWI88729.1 glycosyltransferase involved in cell wall biosynthesis [Chitinophaga japonensis]